MIAYTLFYIIYKIVLNLFLLHVNLFKLTIHTYLGQQNDTLGEDENPSISQT